MDNNSGWIAILDWILKNYEKAVFILVFGSGVWTYIYRIYLHTRNDSDRLNFQTVLQEELKSLREELHNTKKQLNDAIKANDRLRAELLDRVRSSRNAQP